jgi:hypothetical protein
MRIKKGTMNKIAAIGGELIINIISEIPHTKNRIRRNRKTGFCFRIAAIIIKTTHHAERTAKIV